MGRQQSGELLEGLEAVEQLFEQYPAPKPDQQVKESIKSQISAALSQKHSHRLRNVFCRVVATSAVVAIVATVSIRVSQKPGSAEQGFVSSSIMPAAIWESDDIAVDDLVIATLTAELEQIEADTLAFELNENMNLNPDVTASLEMELIEIDNEFWKG